MKISNLISELEGYKDEYGDVDVLIRDSEMNNHIFDAHQIEQVYDVNDKDYFIERRFVFRT